MQIGRLSSSSMSSYYNNNKPRIGGMGTKNPIQCKKHPKHRQSPGVCSLCLSEKLSRVSTSSPSSSSSRPYYCSSSSLSSTEDTSCASSPDVAPRHRRIASDVLLKRARDANANANANAAGFLKSRSMAFVEAGDGRLRSQESNQRVVSKKASSGFWSKLLRPRKNKKMRDANYHHNNIMIISQSQPLGPSSSSSTAVVY